MFDFLKGQAKKDNTSSAAQSADPDTNLGAPAPTPAQAAGGSPADGKYTVRPGDSLSKIAKKFNVPLAQVVAANPQIKDPNLIHPNEVIKLG